MKESYQKQFRGVWISPEIMDMVESKVISIKEGWLLIIIDSLVQYGGKDCFASNKYLSERIGVGVDMLGKMISRLKKEKLLIQTKFDGRKRYLKTCWSRLVITEQTRKKLRGCIVKNYEADGNPPYINNKEENNYPNSDEYGKVSEKPPIKKLHPRWRKYATKLADAIQKTMKVNYKSKINSWAKQFELVYKRDRIPISRIRNVLEWYCKELETPGQYLPEAYSGASFRSKFVRIEKSMNREPSLPPRDEASEGPIKVDTKPLLDHFRMMAKTDPDNYEGLEDDLTEDDLQAMAGTFNRTGEMKITRG